MLFRSTFAGVGSFFTSNADIGDSACTLTNHSIVGNRLTYRDITNETNTVVSVRLWGIHHLKSIDLDGCQNISDIGLSFLAEGIII